MSGLQNLISNAQSAFSSSQAAVSNFYKKSSASLHAKEFSLNQKIGGVVTSVLLSLTAIKGICTSRTSKKVVVLEPVVVLKPTAQTAIVQKTRTTNVSNHSQKGDLVPVALLTPTRHVVLDKPVVTTTIVSEKVVELKTEEKKPVVLSRREQFENKLKDGLDAFTETVREHPYVTTAVVAATVLGTSLGVAKGIKHVLVGRDLARGLAKQAEKIVEKEKRNQLIDAFKNRESEKRSELIDAFKNRESEKRSELIKAMKNRDLARTSHSVDVLKHLASIPNENYHVATVNSEVASYNAMYSKAMQNRQLPGDVITMNSPGALDRETTKLSNPPIVEHSFVRGGASVPLNTPVTGFVASSALLPSVASVPSADTKIDAPVVLVASAASVPSADQVD